MTDSHNPTLREEFIKSQLVISPDYLHTDGNLTYITLEDFPTMSTRLKALITDEIVKELEAIVQLRENRNGLLAYDEASEQIKKRIAERKKELL